MNAFSERPGLREQMICALAGSQMTPVEGRECALDRIAAIGAAQIAAEQIVRARADAGLAPIAPARAAAARAAAPVYVPDVHRIGGAEAYASCAMDASPPSDASPSSIAPPSTPSHEAAVAYTPGAPTIAIEPELAAILLRRKYLDDRALSTRAVDLFARVLPRRHVRGASAMLLRKIAGHAIAEWICSTCPACRGTGRRGATMGGVTEKLVACRTCERIYGKPSGMVRMRLPDAQAMARVSCPACCGRRTVIDRKRVRGRVGVICGRCEGTGHFLPREVDRAEAIGVTPSMYRSRWASVFDAALHSVRALDRRLMGNVREQLGRDLGSAA